jgi:hypothetical protein
MWHEWREDERIYVIGKTARLKETTKKTRHTWINNIKIDLIERGWTGLVRIGLTQYKYSWEFL